MVMKAKRGQAAMEFLMTYGWAILVVLVVIGALAYFGVLSPQKLLPDKCTLPPGMLCDDYSLSETSGVQMIISNGLGKTITITDMVVVESASGDEVCVSLAPTTTLPPAIPNGKKDRLSCGDVGALSDYEGEKTKFDVKLTYVFGSDPTASGVLTHISEGEIYATVSE